jgi:hypothetical protein
MELSDITYCPNLSRPTISESGHTYLKEETHGKAIIV